MSIEVRNAPLSVTAPIGGTSDAVAFTVWSTISGQYRPNTVISLGGINATRARLSLDGVTWPSAWGDPLTVGTVTDAGTTVYLQVRSVDSNSDGFDDLDTNTDNIVSLTSLLVLPQSGILIAGGTRGTVYCSLTITGNPSNSNPVASGNVIISTSGVTGDAYEFGRVPTGGSNVVTCVSSIVSGNTVITDPRKAVPSGQVVAATSSISGHGHVFTAPVRYYFTNPDTPAAGTTPRFSTSIPTREYTSWIENIGSEVLQQATAVNHIIYFSDRLNVCGSGQEVNLGPEIVTGTAHIEPTAQLFLGLNTTFSWNGLPSGIQGKTVTYSTEGEVVWDVETDITAFAFIIGANFWVEF
jgi:hypothetical protein